MDPVLVIHHPGLNVSALVFLIVALFALGVVIGTHLKSADKSLRDLLVAVTSFLFIAALLFRFLAVTVS